jgi:hypothetical protein
VRLQGADIHCPAQLSTYCVAETGTYFGQVGVRASSRDRLELVAGAAAMGFASVHLNGQRLSFDVQGVESGAVVEHRASTPTAGAVCWTTSGQKVSWAARGTRQ